MGRHPVNIPFNADALRKIMNEHECTFSDRAAQYGVSRQAVNGWLSVGRIPPRALAEIALDLKLHPGQIEEILTVIQPKQNKTTVVRRFTISIHVDENLDE